MYCYEAPFTAIDAGKMYYCSVIGDDNTIAHGVLLPGSLKSKIPQALHASVINRHSSANSTSVTYSIVRTSRRIFASTSAIVPVPAVQDYSAELHWQLMPISK